MHQNNMAVLEAEKIKYICMNEKYLLDVDDCKVVAVV
jgi:hypothetical protein